MAGSSPAKGTLEAVQRVKLFQIEEPDGIARRSRRAGRGDRHRRGGELAEVAFAIGGNAVILADREGFERELPVPPLDAPRRGMAGAV